MSMRFDEMDRRPFQQFDPVNFNGPPPRAVMAREVARLAGEDKPTWWTYGDGMNQLPYANKVRMFIRRNPSVLGDLLANDDRALVAENRIVEGVLRIKHRLNESHKADHIVRARIGEVYGRVREFIEKASVVDVLRVLA